MTLRDGPGYRGPLTLARWLIGAVAGLVVIIIVVRLERCGLDTACLLAPLF